MVHTTLPNRSSGSGSSLLPNLIDQVRAFNPTLAAEIEAATQHDTAELAELRQWRDSFRQDVSESKAERDALMDSFRLRQERFTRLGFISRRGMFYIHSTAAKALGVDRNTRVSVYRGPHGWLVTVHPGDEPGEPLRMHGWQLPASVFDELRADFPALHNGSVQVQLRNGRDKDNGAGVYRLYDLVEDVSLETEID